MLNMVRVTFPSLRRELIERVGSSKMVEREIVPSGF